MKIIILYCILVLSPTDIYVQPIQEFRGLPHLLEKACETTKQEILPLKGEYFVCKEKYIENGI